VQRPSTSPASLPSGKATSLPRCTRLTAALSRPWCGSTLRSRLPPAATGRSLPTSCVSCSATAGSLPRLLRTARRGKVGWSARLSTRRPWPRPGRDRQRPRRLVLRERPTRSSRRHRHGRGSLKTGSTGTGTMGMGTGIRTGSVGERAGRDTSNRCARCRAAGRRIPAGFQKIAPPEAGWERRRSGGWSPPGWWSEDERGGHSPRSPGLSGTSTACSCRTSSGTTSRVRSWVEARTT